MSEQQHEKTAAGLDRRVPQASEGAQVDRRMSWSGRITLPAEGCQDLDLMAWVYERLHHL